MTQKGKENMKRFGKSVIAVMIVLCMLGLSSCATVKTYLNDYKAINSATAPDTDFRLSADMNYEFDEKIVQQIEDRFLKMEELLEANNPVRALPFLLLFSKQTQDMFYVADHATLCNVRYYLDPSDEKAMEKYSYLNKLYTDFSSRLLSMYRPIYESNYRYLFFGTMSKSEVTRLLSLADGFSGEVAILTKERNDLVSDYRKLDINGEDFFSESARIYEQIVKKNNEIAKASEYESYPEYAYDVVYSRDYTTDQAKQLYEYVKQYVVPMTESVQFDLKEAVAGNSILAQRLVEEEEALFGSQINFSTSNALLSDYYALQYWDSDNFIDNWENHSIFGDENSYPVAFTTYLRYYNYTLCYFGAGYQDLSICVHEQGHYSAFTETPGGYSSLDLNEVHSQGNEWLHYAYLGSQHPDEELYGLIVKEKLYEHCMNIIISTACDMFEQRVYADESLSAEEYDGVFDQCVKELGATSLLEEGMSMKPSEYWHKAIVGNSMYYLSYAVSLLPSIELYLVAQEQGLEDAVDCYLALTDGAENIDFLDAIDDAGLSSPFEENVYVRLKEYFE